MHPKVTRLCRRGVEVRCLDYVEWPDLKHRCAMNLVLTDSVPRSRHRDVQPHSQLEVSVVSAHLCYHSS